MKPAEPEVMYRYDEIEYHTNAKDGFILPHGRNIKVELKTFDVVKRTRRGTWISLVPIYMPIDEEDRRSRKFILSGARKKYACETIPEAKESYLRRKHRQIEILTHKLNRAKIGLQIMKQTGERKNEDNRTVIE
jgi:hypothetical protein